MVHEKEEKPDQSHHEVQIKVSCSQKPRMFLNAGTPVFQLHYGVQFDHLWQWLSLTNDACN